MSTNLEPASGPTGFARLRIVGAVGAVFSGVALLLFLLLDVALPVGLAVTGGAAAAMVAVAVRMAAPRDRRLFRRALGAGAVAGIAATLAYDAARLILAQVDSSPYNPLEAIRGFGILFTGGDAAAGFALGVGYHLLNGTLFGVAWTFAAGGWSLGRPRRAVATAIAWGLGLEIMQVTLYPTWLDIRAYSEFVTISALGHLVYGGVLGLLGERLLRRIVVPVGHRLDAATVEAIRKRLQEGDSRSGPRQG